MSELVVDLRGETGESRRRRQRARAAGFVIVVAALYVLLSDQAAAPTDAVVSIDPDFIDFDARPIGDTATREIRIRNAGTTPVRVSRIVNATETQSDFTIPSSSCTTIEPQRDCIVTVEFRPSREGPQETSFEVLDGKERGVGTIGVRGAGTRVAAILELTPPEFDDVLLGESSEARSILVMHRGGAPVRIVSVAPNDAVGFAVAADNCSGVLLQRSASCTVDIVFKPPSRGTVTGSWTITDEQAAHEVRVTARGLARHLAFTPDVLNFSPLEVGAEAEQALTVTNDGDVPIVVEDIGADAPFIVAKSCAGPLAPGGQCQATIVFRPRTVGDVSGRVVIRGTGGAEEAALTANGVAFERPQEQRIGVLSADPKSPIQMTKFNEERPIAITNVGNAPVTINRVRLSISTRRVGWLGVKDLCSDRTLSPGGQCVVILKVVMDDYRIPKQRLILDTVGTAAVTFEVDVVAPRAGTNAVIR